MKCFLTIFIGLIFSLVKLTASEKIIVTPILNDFASSEVKEYLILNSEQSKEIMILSAKKIAKLGTWTIEFMIPDRKEKESDVDFSLTKEAMLSGLDCFLRDRDVLAKEIRVVRIDMQINRDLWESFAKEMKELFVGLDGLVEPKSKAVFQRFKEFLDRSKLVQEISEMLSLRLSSDVRSILPGEEINFENEVIGKKWKQLIKSSTLGFYQPVTFCVIFNKEK